MNDSLRYLLAGILIFLIILLQPLYLEWLGYDPEGDSMPNENVVVVAEDPVLSNTFQQNAIISSVDINKSYKNFPMESFITISSSLYTATLSNRSGGSFVNYILKDNELDKRKYMGSYGDGGLYNSDLPVSLIMPLNTGCMPCLASYDEVADKYIYFNQPFSLMNPPGSDTLFLGSDESLKLVYKIVDQEGAELITKSVVFSGSSYISSHVFSINNRNLDLPGGVEFVWDGGLRPAEEKEDEDVQYGSGIISQAGEIDDITMNAPDKNIERQVYKGQTEWVAVRTKYFISALLAESPGTFAALSAENVSFGSRKHTPLYSAAIGYPFDVSSVSSRVYLGPLDVDHISRAGSGLDATMNWGFAVIRPISKGILWVLKFMHKTFHINYGIVLLLFAIFIRLITGPLTKKSFQSSQNMQKIQPELKRVQAKFKGDPQGLNRETMALYKKHKVNPLGGCLPILLQMPLLWALFIVFRTTIEFRGAPFVLWINDLSRPDVVFNLPFSIPIYGSGVAILPLIMGTTLIMTMRMNSATMDKNQKPVMYFMNVFFVLLFNTFPSGLNLYYTAYNILSFFQQRSIKTKS